nr:type II toxin-antitoxin system RelE/ParE family toxin [Clostridia bacterium]
MDIDVKYEVEFTEECAVEIRKVYNYIRDDLSAQNSANKIMERIEEFITNLAYVPRMYAEIDKYSNTKRIYRRIILNNYVLLYTIDEERHKVFISHMYHSKTDYLNNI